MNTQSKNGREEILSRPSRKKKPLASTLILLTTVSSGAMLGMAMPNLVGDDSSLGIAKALLIAGAATTVAYGVNRLAIEKGAPLTAINFVGAGVTSVASILIVGAGLFASTFAGLTIGSVAELRLQEYGTKLSQYITYRNQIVTKAGQSGPAIQSIATDLKLKALCEFKDSCVSGRGQGGRGTITRILEDKSARATGIKEQFTAGEAKRKSTLFRLNGLLANYQKALGNEENSISEKRAALQKIDAEIGQSLSDLDEALPISLLNAYANELQSGVEIQDRPTATARLNDILRSHGRSLETVLEDIEQGKKASIIFPGKTGVADTFKYFGHFLPIAAVVFVVELVLPLTLWLYTFFTLYWKRFKQEPVMPDAEDQLDDDGFGGLIVIPSSNQVDPDLPKANNRRFGSTHNRPRRKGESDRVN